MLRSPLADPVLVVALGTALFLSVPLVFERLRIPAVIGLILAGAAIGPHGFNLLQRDSTVVLLGTVGLLYLMFMAAVEIDLHGLNRARGPSLVLGATAFAIPLLLGSTAGRALGYHWNSSILLGSLLASHTLLAYPVATRLGIGKNRAVTAAVGATVITDVLVLVVLSVAEAQASGELGVGFWLRFAGSTTVFLLAVFIGLPRLARAFFRRQDSGEIGEYMFVIAALFASAVLSQAAGLEPIIGAFFAGLALNTFVAEGTPLHNRLQFFGNALLIPFFLLSIGMLVDFRVFASAPQVWIVIAVMLGAALIGKWLATVVTARRFKFSSDEQRTMFGLSIPQAAATLAVVLVGYRSGLLNDTILNGAIVLILVTCMVGPWLVQSFGLRVANADVHSVPEGGRAPQRILIDVTIDGDAQRLMDLAFLAREVGSKEPLLPTAVVEGYRRDAGQMAAVEKVLGSTVTYCAGAAVPVLPMTRVDRNMVSGLTRAMAEGRATAVVAGWDGKRARRTGVLSERLDQLLLRTKELTLVAHLDRPLSVVTRVIVILPRDIARSAGLLEAVECVKRIASRASATLHVIHVGTLESTWRSAVDAARPDVPTEWSPVDGWASLAARLREIGAEGDLVTLISERRGMAAWRRDLDSWPRRLVERHAPDVLVVFPRVGEMPLGGAAAFTKALGEGRVALNVPCETLDTAFSAMLATAPALSARQTRLAVRALTQSAEGGALELIPGAIFVGARVASVSEPTLFLGINPRGIPFPKATQPARVTVAALTPERGPGPSQLLADVAPLISNAERIHALCQAADVASVVRSFRVEDRDTVASPGLTLMRDAQPSVRDEAGMRAD